MTQQSELAAAAPSSAIARHWHNRRIYRRNRDWLWSLYNRALRRSIGRLLPGRGKLRAVHLKDVSRPVYIRLGTTDWLVLEEVFRDNAYGMVLSRLSDARHVVDLGSNIGLSVRLWQKHFPSAEIVAVEPDQGNLSVCRFNIEAGENPKRVRVLQTCAAGTSRPVELKRSGGEWGFSIASSAQGDSVAIQSQTMPQILEQAGGPSRVDLLKCDIEGAEQELFADCSPWIRRIHMIIIELHAPYTKQHFLDDISRGGGDFHVTSIYESGWNSVLLLTSKNG